MGEPGEPASIANRSLLFLFCDALIFSGSPLSRALQIGRTKSHRRSSLGPDDLVRSSAIQRRHPRNPHHLMISSFGRSLAATRLHSIKPISAVLPALRPPTRLFSIRILWCLKPFKHFPDAAGGCPFGADCLTILYDRIDRIGQLQLMNNKSLEIPSQNAPSR